MHTYTYIPIYTCMHTCTHIKTCTHYTRTHIQLHTHILHIHLHTHIYTYTNAQIYTHIHTLRYTHTLTYRHIQTYTHMHTCTHIKTCTHITHTHTLTLPPSSQGLRGNHTFTKSPKRCVWSPSRGLSTRAGRVLRAVLAFLSWGLCLRGPSPGPRSLSVAPELLRREGSGGGWGRHQDSGLKS